MKKITAAALVGLSLVTALIPVQASAQEFRHGGPPRYEQRDGGRPDRGGDRRDDHRSSDRDLAIGGIIGLTSGIIVGNSIYDRPRYDRRMPPPPPRYGGYHGRPRFDDRDRFGPRPWSLRWYRWCSNAHRSFNPNTGLFIGRDGRRHFCQP